MVFAFVYTLMNLTQYFMLSIKDTYLDDDDQIEKLRYMVIS